LKFDGSRSIARRAKAWTTASDSSSWDWGRARRQPSRGARPQSAFALRRRELGAEVLGEPLERRAGLLLGPVEVVHVARVSDDSFGEGGLLSEHLLTLLTEVRHVEQSFTVWEVLPLDVAHEPGFLGALQ
jgi:hypothetical protein